MSCGKNPHPGGRPRRQRPDAAATYSEWVRAGKTYTREEKEWLVANYGTSPEEVERIMALPEVTDY